MRFLQFVTYQTSHMIPIMLANMSLYLYRAL